MEDFNSKDWIAGYVADLARYLMDAIKGMDEEAAAVLINDVHTYMRKAQATLKAANSADLPGFIADLENVLYHLKTYDGRLV
jgi:hypothetical protein